MRMRFILSETWTSLRRNVSMIISVMLVTFISFVFIGASVLIQAQITKAKGDWYDKVEVVVWLCPDGTSQSASCSTGKAPTQQEIVDLEDVINNELGSDVSKITYMSREEFFKNTFLKQYPNGVYEGRTLTASDMQDSLRLKLKDPTKYQVVSEVLTGRTGVEAVVDQRQIFDPVFSVLNRATVVTVVLAGCHGGRRHHADRDDDSHERRLPEERDRDHASGGCFELDDSIAVHPGGRGGVPAGIAAGGRRAERHRQGVRHRLVGDQRAVDAVHHADDGVADRPRAGGGGHAAVGGCVRGIAATLSQGVTCRRVTSGMREV